MSTELAVRKERQILCLKLEMYGKLLTRKEVLATVRQTEDSIKKDILDKILKKPRNRKKSLKRKLNFDHKLQLLKKTKQSSVYCDDSDDNKESFVISILKEYNMEVTYEMPEWAKHSTRQICSVGGLLEDQGIKLTTSMFVIYRKYVTTKEKFMS